MDHSCRFSQINCLHLKYAAIEITNTDLWVKHLQFPPHFAAIIHHSKAISVLCRWQVATYYFDFLSSHN